MKRHFDLLISIFLLSACATTSDPVGAIHESPLRTPEQKIFTIAIMEFEDYGFDQTVATQGLGRTLSDRIAERLAGRPDIRLIDRESLQKILEELSLASRDLTDPDNSLRLGRLLGAQYLVMGGYTSLGGGLRIDGRIVEVERGLTEGISLEGHATERATLEQNFANQMADQLIAKVGAMHAPPRSSQDFFLQGIAFERSNNAPKALEMYQKALAIDPQHHEARERMEHLLLKDLQ